MHPGLAAKTNGFSICLDNLNESELPGYAVLHAKSITAARSGRGATFPRSGKHKLWRDTSR